MSETGTGGKNVRGGTQETHKAHEEENVQELEQHEPASEPPPSSKPVSASAPGATASPHPSILIVEDEEPIAEAIAYLVEEAGYLPLRALHGKQALEIARGQRLALIITDLMMPLMDGVELIAALRANAAHDGHVMPPIILMTAASQRRAQSAGADVVLRKPFDLDDLEALMRSLLANSPGDVAASSSLSSPTPTTEAASKDSASRDSASGGSVSPSAAKQPHSFDMGSENGTSSEASKATDSRQRNTGG